VSGASKLVAAKARTLFALKPSASSSREIGVSWSSHGLLPVAEPLWSFWPDRSPVCPPPHAGATSAAHAIARVAPNFIAKPPRTALWRCSDSETSVVSHIYSF
jgi:hypothetical protein